MTATREIISTKAINYINTWRDITNPHIISIEREIKDIENWVWHVEVKADWTNGREITITITYSQHGTMYHVGTLCPDIREGERFPGP